MEFARVRNYDKAIGRFTSRDPIGFVGGLNTYSFANNSPTVFTDASGLQASQNSSANRIISGLSDVSAALGAPAILLLALASPLLAPLFGTIGGAFLITTAIASAAALLFAVGVVQLVDSSANKPFDLGQALTDVAGNTFPNVGLLLDLAELSGRPFQPPNISFEQIGNAIGDFLLGIGLGSNVRDFTTVVPIRRSADPNDIVGPAGFGDERFVAARGPQAYVINFENLATATGAARHVEITQQLDPDLDPRTFRLTGFGFDNQSFDLPGNRAFYSGRIDLSATKGYLVDVTATVDVAAGTLLWVFDTIDPSTGQAPLDAEVGFLLPNDPTHRGEGFVSYIIRPKANVVSGDRIDSQARIIFDTNEPIDTTAIFNTIDAVAPTSLVSALPAQSEATTFEVSWSGVDDSSGAAIADYTIYVSRDGEPPTIWLSNTVLTNALFFGETGHTYAFSVTARDNAGNQEAIHATPDTVIRIGPPDRVDGQTYILSKEEPIVTGTRGDDKFVARAGVLSSRSEIDGAGGRNSLILQGGGRFDLRAPAKLLNVAIVEAQEGQAAFRQNDGTVLPDTRQTIQLRDGQNVTVNVASTDVDPLNPSVPTITIFGANGANVINLGSGNAQVMLGSANETVLGGGGNNSFTVTAATSRANIDGGSGASELIVAGGGTVTLGSNITRIASVSLSSSATGVTQTDYVFTANAIDGLSIVGSKGSDTITIQRASQSVLAGDGDDRIIVDAQGISAAIDGGSGRNILEVMQGGTFTLNAATRNVELLLNQASSIRFESGRTLSFRGSTGADNYLSSASGFIGTSIVGFDAGGDIVSISDIALSGKTKLRYRENADRLGGTLAISDGKRETSINLVGRYTQSLFRLSANGATGVSISYAPIAAQSSQASSTVAGSFADVFTEASNEQSIQFESLPVFDNETFGQLKRTAQTAKEQVLFDAGQSTSRISAFAGQLAEAIAAFDTQNGGLNYGLGSDRQSYSNLYFSNRYEHHQLQ